MPPSKKFVITQEQIDAIRSDYITADALHVVLTEVMKNDGCRERNMRDVALEESLRDIMLTMETLFGNNCLLYALSNSECYCTRRCPLYNHNDGTHCTPRAKMDTIRALLNEAPR